MYAIIEAGGKQYRVSPEDTVAVERLAAEAGEEVVFDRVALVSGDDGVQVGTPWVEGAKVTGKVLGHVRGPKVRIFFFKAKESMKRTKGHRQQYTRVKIENIEAGPAEAGEKQEARNGA